MQRIPYWRLAGFYFFYFCYLGAFVAYFGLYLAALKVSATQIGIVVALPQFARVFAPHLWSWLADHGGQPLRVARIATAAGIVVFCGLFFLHDFDAVFLIVLIMSFFLNAALPLVESATLTFLGKQASRYGRVRLWGSVGFIVASVATGLLLDQTAINVLIWILLGTLIGWLAFLLWIPEAPRIEHAHDHPHIAHVLRRPEVIAWIVACALMAVAHGPYYGFYSIYLVDHGYSKSAIGSLWALGVICEIAVFYWAPHLFRRFSPRRVLLASFALAALRFVLIGLGADNIVVLLFAQVLHAASFGSFHTAAFGYVQQFFHGRHQARGQAIYSGLTFGLGGTLGGIYAGYAWDKLGGGMTFTLGALCALLGMVLFWARVRDSDMARVPPSHAGN